MYEQTVICGDCLEIVGDLQEIAAVVTDPPYGLSFMGKDWDHGIPGPEFWRRIALACKPGAHLLAFGGTRTFHRLVCAIEDAGWEIRDCLMWLYGQGFPKSVDVSKSIDKSVGMERELIAPPPYTRGKTDQMYADGRKVSYAYPCQPITAPATDAAKQWSGWGTALKPAWEPIILARKPLCGTVAANVMAHNCGALNIDASRIALNGDYKCAANGRPSQTGLGDNYDPAKANQPSDVGRYPSNLILDEEPAAMLDGQSGFSKGAKKLISKRPRNKGWVNSSPGDGVSATDNYGDSGGASRFFYCAKTSRKERGDGNNHPTVKPIALLEYLIRLITPPGGIVLDPFVGSGSTLLAARQAGFSAIGIDKDAHYCDIARKRLESQ